MPYNEELAARIRGILGGKPGITEKRMFGGLAFLVDGRMCCGVSKDELMARVDPASHDAALQEPNARPMDFTGRPMRGFLFVGPAGWRDDAALARWVERGLEFAAALPAKTPTRKRRKDASPAG